MPKTDSLKNIIFVRLNFLVQRLVQRKKEILLLITVSVFCFLVLEIVARSIIKEKKNSWYGYPPGLFLPDDTKGFVYKPHFKGLFPNEPFTDISININSKGLRDVEHEYEKPPGTIRILGLGDSVTFGAGVAFEDTYLSQLERKLNDAGYSVEIIKAGVNSYEFDQERTYFKEEGYKYNPDVVILGLFLNDIREITPAEVQKEKKDTENLLKREVTESPPEELSSPKSFVDRVANICKLCEIFISQRREAYNLLYFSKAIEEQWTRDWPRFEERIVDFYSELKKSNIKLLILVFPETEQFSHSHNLTKLPQQRLAEMAQKNDIEIIDLLPFLDVEGFNNIYLNGDSIHPNKAGYKIVSDILYKKLLEKNYVIKSK